MQLLWTLALLPLAASFIHRCPVEQKPPCHCIMTRPDGGFHLEFVCENMRTRGEFTRALKSFRNIRVDSLVLRNSHNMTIWPNDFRRMHVTSISLENLHFRFLQLFGSFRGLERSLMSLSLINTTVTNFEADNGRHLFRLIGLNFTQSPLLTDTIGPDLTAKFPRGLLELRLVKMGIRNILNNTFAKLPFIELLDLSNNHLTTFNRSWFLPSPDYLRQLNLAKNRILSSKLDRGTFRNSPMLYRVNMSRNSISRLEQEVFGPAFEQFAELTLDGNPLDCDCHLTWIRDNPLDYQQHFVLPHCISPGRLRTIHIPEAVRKLGC